MQSWGNSRKIIKLSKITFLNINGMERPTPSSDSTPSIPFSLVTTAQEAGQSCLLCFADPREKGDYAYILSTEILETPLSFCSFFLPLPPSPRPSPPPLASPPPLSHPPPLLPFPLLLLLLLLQCKHQLSTWLPGLPTVKFYHPYLHVAPHQPRAVELQKLEGGVIKLTDRSEQRSPTTKQCLPEGRSQILLLL